MIALVGLQSRRLWALTDSRDAALRAMTALRHYLRREPARIHLVGPISLWLCGGYPFQRVEQLMEELVNEGILRHATPEELRPFGYRHGYFITPEGLTCLPPEDRSYGV